MSTASAAWFPSRGIVHELTAGHTLEQNPVCERANRTQIEIIRPHLFDEEMADRYWPFAARASVQLDNWTVQQQTRTSTHTSDYMALCHCKHI